MKPMAETQQRVLHQIGDRELWVARAEDSSWAIPCWVEWKHDKEHDEHFGHVLPAVCLFHAQALAMVALLQVHDIQGRLDNWVIPRRMVEALLHKAPGVTPRFYYTWPGDDGPPMEPKPPIETDFNKKNRPGRVNKPRTPSFVEWLAKDSKIASSIINAVLNAVADGAPRWLVEHHQPIDLGFCRIIAAPFRANWKEIVTFKAKYLRLRSLFRLSDPQVWTALEDVGLPAILTSPHNVGLRRGWKNESDVVRIEYTLEAIPSEQFETAVSRIEGKRMSRGGAAYITEFEDAVESLYKSLVMALRSHLSKVARPFAKVGIGGQRRVLGFLPVLGRKVEVRRTPLSRLPIRGVDTDSGFSVYGNSDDAHFVCAQAAAMQALPPVSSATHDMRERTIEAKLDITNGGDPAAGLPVRHERQIENGGS